MFRIVMMALAVAAVLAAGEVAYAEESEQEQAATGPSFSQLFIDGYEKEMAGEFAAAVELYGRAIELRENSPAVLIRRAKCLVRMGQLEPAAVDLRKAFAMSPVTMTDYQAQAWMLATMPVAALRDGTRAVTFGRKILDEQESDIAYDILAAAYAEMGNFQRARDTILAGMKKYPDSSRAEGMAQRFELYRSRKPYREPWTDDERGLQRELGKRR